jgi:hypothetical protein
VVTGAALPTRTRATGWLLAVPLLVGATCTLLTLAALLDLRTSGRGLLAVLLVGAALAALRVPMCPRRVADLGDLLTALSGAATFAVLWHPMAGASTGRRLIALSHITDAATHLQFTRAVLEHGGYLTFRHGLDSQVTTGAQHYPPALSGTLGMLTHALLGGPGSLAGFLATVVPLLVGLAALLSATGTRLALSALHGLHPDAGILPVVLTGLAGTVLGIAGFGTLLMRSSAYAQLLATLALLAAALLVLELGRSARQLPPALLLASVASTQAWYLLGPLLALPWLVALRGRQGHPVRFWACVGGTAALSAFPLLNGPGRGTLNAVGAFDAPSNAGTLAFAAATVGAVVLLVLGDGPRLPRLLPSSLAVGTVSLAVAVGTYQVATTGTIAYYALKVMLSAYVMAGVVTAMAVGVVTVRAAGRRGWARLAPVGALLVALAMPTTAWAGIPGFRSYLENGGASARESAMLTAVLQRHPDGLSTDVDAWLVDRCDAVRDYVLSKWVYDLSLGWTARREHLYPPLLDKDRNVYLDFARSAEQAGLQRVEIYVSHSCAPAQLAQVADLPGVEIVRVR